MAKNHDRTPCRQATLQGEHAIGDDPAGEEEFVELTQSTSRQSLDDPYLLPGRPSGDRQSNENEDEDEDESGDDDDDDDEDDDDESVCKK